MTEKLTAAEVQHYRRLVASAGKWGERIHPWYGPCDGFGRNGECAECGRTLAQMEAELARLHALVEKQRAALFAIHERKNQVCSNYELCDHVGCASSYEAFAIADGALDQPAKVGEE